MKGDFIIVGMGALGTTLSAHLHHDNCIDVITIESKDFEKETPQEIPRIPINLYFTVEKSEDIILFPFILPRAFYEPCNTLIQERTRNLSLKDRARIRSPSEKNPHFYMRIFLFL